MALTVTDEGERVLLDHMFSEDGTDYKIDLYTNNLAPTATRVLADYTFPTFVGYAEKTLSRDLFGAATTNAQGKAQVEYSDDLVFTNTSGDDATIYGYVLSTGVGSILLAIEPYEVAKSLNDGEQITQRIIFTLVSQL